MNLVVHMVYLHMGAAQGGKPYAGASEPNGPYANIPCVLKGSPELCSALIGSMMSEEEYDRSPIFDIRLKLKFTFQKIRPSELG